MQQFETGATRDDDADKNDYEGYLSPLVIEAYGDYMTEHRKQADGQLRASDNWQKGIPRDKYIKSGLRHAFDVWKLHRGYPCFDKRTGNPVTIRAAINGVLFNFMGYFHEYLKENLNDKASESPHS